ncbi:MAG: 4-(cytidine 5'-diphospho)-2-C-methyl-D-erythritol kinase [Paludibacter sp.]|nr:4-(cytidine 5'-diphospho)-2-C-methyl-D-erythritol kinase [Paludibacter sp.]
MRFYPNAKINIGLNITEKRSDGYHNIQTVFYPIPLSDELDVNILDVSSNADLQSDYKFQISGININTDPEKNLIIRAYRLLQQNYHLQPVDIHLKKLIPFGAGLGGGSSDAAYMLKALNQLFELNLSGAELERFAVKLGADCPVFINNQAVFAEGIGNVFQPVDFSLEGYYILLIKPDVFVSTPDAYASVIPAKPKYSLLESIKKPVADWKDCIINDFENSVFRKYPIVGEIKRQLYEKGALFALMSGSGSSVYGIFDHYPTDMSGFDNCFKYVGRF